MFNDCGGIEFGVNSEAGGGILVTAAQEGCAGG